MNLLHFTSKSGSSAKFQFKHKPASSASTTNPPQLAFISLSRLKNLMPQNHITTKLIPSQNPSLNPQSLSSSTASYRSNQVDQSNCLSRTDHEKLARVKAHSVSSSPQQSAGIESIDNDTPTLSTLASYEKLSGNQVVAQVTQQERNPLRANSSQTDSRSSLNFYTPLSRNIKGVEPNQSEQEDQLFANREERKRTKKDSIDSSSYNHRSNSASSCSSKTEKKSRNGEQRSGYTNIRNNMTPSSLLLIQNHNYIEEQEQQQQQQRNTTNYHNSNHNPQERENDISIGQSRITTTDSFARGTANLLKQTDDHSEQRPQQHCNESTLSSSSSSSSSSSLMLNNINQFKALDSVGNSSISNSGHNLSASSATTVDSSSYLASQDINSTSNPLLEADTLTPLETASNLQHSYQQQGTAPSEFKATTSGSHFVHYSDPNSRLQNTNYHHNFQATMLEQQIKFESAINARNIFDGNNSAAIDINVSSGNSMNVVRDLARQRAGTNSYYNTHYNLMPTPSSKSSSPPSSTSTPSPKTNAMHQHSSHHSNQILSSSANSNATTAQIHLDQLNHHYMNNSGNLNQQHQVSQQYYSHQTSGIGTHQYQLSVSNHDQTYTQQPQQNQLQHLQHQQLPLEPQPQPIQQHQQQQHNLQQHQQQVQHQHHHQQLHQHQSQQPQQHNLANQHSIYHQLANKAAGVNHIYGATGNGTHYQGHLQGNVAAHQPNHLMPGNHQNHLNSAAAACAAAAVVSQTLKTVASQHSQQNQYGPTIASGFGPTSGNIMNMTAQHHQQFHNMNSLNHHHLTNQSSVAPHPQTNLQNHHTNSIVTRKYQCKMCPQVFMSKAEMKFHNQNHMREAKPYKCLQCPKAFANSSYLSQHMRIHQGVKPYSCDICARKFTQLSHLQQHKRTHTGDKPYKCNYMNCTKQFSQLSNLQSHSRCHQLDKPYKCNSCYKCFHDEQSLLEHIPRHLESKHLKKNLCIFCGSSYQQERGLVKHFQQYHTDKTPTLVAAAIAAGTTGNTNLIASLVSSNTNTFATPSSGGSSSSSSSSTSSSGSLSMHNNLNVAHGATAAFGTNQYG